MSKPLSERVFDLEFEKFDHDGPYGLWSTLRDEIAALESQLRERDEALAEMRKSRNEHAAKRMNLEAQNKKQQEEIRRLREALERMPTLVPTTWLDPLLTGPDAVIGDEITGKDVEKLLFAIKGRLESQGLVQADD